MSGFNSIAEIVENTAGLPIGSIRAIANFDFNGLLASRVAIANKDRARIEGFVPAVLQRAADLGVTVGIEIGLASAEGGAIIAESITVEKSQAFDQLVREALKVVEAFYRQATHPTDDGFDPFRQERELVRIFAKRNGLDPAYQALLGVSEATPTEYP